MKTSLIIFIFTSFLLLGGGGYFWISEDKAEVNTHDYSTSTTENPIKNSPGLTTTTMTPEVKNISFSQNKDDVEMLILPRNEQSINEEKQFFNKFSNHSITFLTFADGNDNYRARGIEFITKARKDNKKYQWFDHLILCNDTCLEPSWVKKNKDILDQPRGHGYWLWKPYIIQKILKSMNENDILVYIDVGSTIDWTDEVMYRDVIDSVIRSHDGLLGWDMNFIEHEWTKGNLRAHIDLDDAKWNSGQILAGIQVLRKCDHVMSFVSQWLSLGEYGNGKFIDDSPSDVPNHPNFRDNRHDQSIQSVLKKKMGYTPRRNRQPFPTTRIRTPTKKKQSKKIREMIIQF